MKLEGVALPNIYANTGNVLSMTENEDKSSVQLTMSTKPSEWITVEVTERC